MVLSYGNDYRGLGKIIEDLKKILKRWGFHRNHRHGMDMFNITERGNKST